MLAAALDMNLQQLAGWRLLILCLLAGSLGAMWFIWAKGRLLPKWGQLSTGKKAALVVVGTGLALAETFFQNRHKPNESAADFLGVVTILFILLLWALYGLWSRFLDALYGRFFKR